MMERNEGSEALSVPPISVSRILTKPRDLSRAISAFELLELVSSGCNVKEPTILQIKKFA